ncbi:MAG: hypothetical protein V3S56_00440, partial [Gemmatimonadota bacterium]
ISNQDPNHTDLRVVGDRVLADHQNTMNETPMMPGPSMRDTVSGRNGNADVLHRTDPATSRPSNRIGG